MEEKVIEDIDVKIDKEDGDNVIFIEIVYEKLEFKIGKDEEEILLFFVEVEEVNIELKKESE